MSAKRTQKVHRGNDHLAVYPWTHPATGRQRWRFAVIEDGRRRYRTFKTKVDAITAAERTLAQIPAGLAWDSLDADTRRFLSDVHRATTPADRPAVLAFLQSRATSAEISAAVAAFTTHKTTEAGEKTPHLRQVFSQLRHFSAHFHGRQLSDIQSADLAAYLETTTAGKSAKTRKDARANLVTFFRWALKQGIAGSDPITAADRLPNIKVGAASRQVLTAAELCAVLNAIDPEFRAWAVLGAFAGLRPEEIAPSHIKRSQKRGLHCEEIDWQFSVIRLPAEASKVNRPRIIPMNSALIAGLKWAGIQPGMTGPTTLRNPAKPGELARLGREVFGGAWPQDALRHSYGSYRNAILRNLDQVSEEMGNSVAMLHRHYHNPQPQELGQAWFSLAPTCSANDPLKITWTLDHSPTSETGIPVKSAFPR